MDWEEKVLNRQSANLKITRKLQEAIMKYPNLRFIQLLFSLGIVNNLPDGSGFEDRFYEESVDTLDKIENENTDREED